MKTNGLFTAICLLAGVLLAGSCSQNEQTDDAVQDLPEGKYPLQITSVSVTGENTAEPWGANAPQSRVAEDDSRNNSVWETNDEIRVGIDGYLDSDSKIYRMTVSNGTVTVSPSSSPVYWRNKDAKYVMACYPADGAVALDNQTEKLAYALFAKTENMADYNATNISLPFQHKLAKIRVALTGDKKNDVTEVKIKTLTSCTLGADGTLTNGSTEDFIPMVKTTYNSETCWEANVVPAHPIKAFQVNGNDGKLNNVGITPVAAAINTINIKLKAPIAITPSDGSQTLNLTDGDVVNIEGDATITTSGNYYTFNISEGNTATVNLNGVKLNWSGNINNGIRAFSIDGGGTIVFNLCGKENTIQNFYYGIRGNDGETAANIHIVGSGTLNINGSNVCGGIVTDKTKEIRIENATVNMDYQYWSGGIYGAAIGSGSGEECGDIMISNSAISIKIATTLQDGTLTANKWFGAAIGAGYGSTCGNITITLQEGQTQAQFLGDISVQHTGLKVALTNEQKVGKGVYGQSCSAVTWLNADGSAATE